MNTFYALQAPDGRFWDGTTPYRASGSLKRIAEWKPRFSSLTTNWARLATVHTKLYAYERIRVVRPDLPQLIIGKYEVTPQLVETKEWSKLTTVEKIAAMIYFTHSASMADEFRAAVHEITPGLQYAMSVRASKKLLQKHLPNAHIGKNYVFGTDEDLVMLKMMGVLKKHHDITSFLDTLDESS